MKEIEPYPSDNTEREVNPSNGACLLCHFVLTMTGCHFGCTVSNFDIFIGSLSLTSMTIRHDLGSLRIQWAGESLWLNTVEYTIRIK